MGLYALVKDALVINTIVWDGDDFDFGEGVTPVEIMEGVSVSIGYLYKKNRFLAPPLKEEQIEENRLHAITLNMAVKSELMSQASAAIAPLQDAVDLGDSTEAEIESLKLWKLYRVSLSRIDSNTPENISWPEQPPY